MTFSNIRSASWLKNYTNWLPIIQWGGWIIAVFIFAKIVWIWVLMLKTPSEFNPIKVTAAKASQSNDRVNVNQLVNLNLFGQAIVEKPKVAAEVIDAPETKLNLKLRGIYSSDDNLKANAIIEDGGGKQAVYFVDEKLAVSGQVFLRQVYIDKVILETNGRKETLKLDLDEQVKTAIVQKQNKTSGPKKANVEDMRNNQRISKQLNHYKKKLMSDPKSVSDVISGRPHFIDGELKGFSISPGRDKKLFEELGLRRGDLVTSINGVALTNMQDAMTLMNDAQSINDLNIDIERNGQPINLLLNLNDKVGM